MMRPPLLESRPWLEAVFASQSARSGGVVRRSIRDVEREVGRDVFIAAVRQRRFHLVECGGQFVVICNPGLLRVVC